jgi:hypothetical protein
MHFVQIGDEKPALQTQCAPAHMPGCPVPQSPGATIMFHHNDHLRFSAFGDARISTYAPRESSRVRARNTDMNTLLDKLGLSGRARKL